MPEISPSAFSYEVEVRSDFTYAPEVVERSGFTLCVPSEMIPCAAFAST